MNASKTVTLTEEQISEKALAHVLPISVFMVLLVVISFLEYFGFVVYNEDIYPWYRYAPEQWVYPLQTIICLILIKKYWSKFEIGPLKGFKFSIVMGFVGISIWAAVC